jgi:predicted Zn-dependent protease
MLKRSAIDKIIPILKKDCKRTLRMKLPGFPKPYYASFLLRDIEWFNTWASSGSTYRNASDHSRNVYCDLRVGSYRYDQTTNGGLFDFDDELDSYNHIKVPIDDKNLEGLRVSLWKLSEAKFREALSDYSEKQASGVTSVDQNKKYRSFSKGKSVRSIRTSRATRIDQKHWQSFCKKASKWLSGLRNISANWVEFDVSQESKIFVNTEGSAIVQSNKIFSLIAGFRRLTKEGLYVEQEMVFHESDIKDLPSFKEFQKEALDRYKKLNLLTKAKPIHSFSGPVLLYPKPAGLLMHEAIGHRLEGCRLLSSGEGQTFKGQIDKQILDVGLTIRDNPKLKSFGGKGCIGAYEFDDEGTPAQDAVLMEGGVLAGFLTTRAQCYRDKDYQSNGHARNRKHQRPISRMAVTSIEAEAGLDLQDLRKLLLDEIRKQNKPFGLIVYETAGGETDTTNYDFQAFSGEISYAALIYQDGREELVRGVDFVGTPLQALSNIIAAGSERIMENHYCGAESGFLPVTTISPAILLSHLEMQLKEQDLVTQYILPKPKL